MADDRKSQVEGEVDEDVEYGPHEEEFEYPSRRVARRRRLERSVRRHYYGEEDNNVDIDAGAEIDTKNPEAPVVVTWKHRRQMAWVSLVSILILTVGVTLVIPIERLEGIEDLLITVLWCLFGVIASYMGFTSIPWFGKGKM